MSDRLDVPWRLLLDTLTEMSIKVGIKSLWVAFEAIQKSYGAQCSDRRWGIKSKHLLETLTEMSIKVGIKSLLVA